MAEDLNAELYESYHISFLEPLPRALLEELAGLAAKDGTGDLIEQVGSIAFPYKPFDCRF
jgi:sec1 family domain-containing protein 1